MNKPHELDAAIEYLRQSVDDAHMRHSEGWYLKGMSSEELASCRAALTVLQRERER